MKSKGFKPPFQEIARVSRPEAERYGDFLGELVGIEVQVDFPEDHCAADGVGVLLMLGAARAAGQENRGPGIVAKGAISPVKWQ